MKKKIIWAFLLLGFLNAYSQNKLNYGLILGADRLIGVNEPNPEGLSLSNRTIPKIGVFVEKKFNSKYIFNAGLTYHRFFENYKYMNRIVNSTERRLWEIEFGPNKYLDLNVGVKTNFYKNFYLNSGLILSYHRNSHSITMSMNPVNDAVTFLLRQSGRENINGGVYIGASYEINPKKSIVIEPFANINVSVTNREKFSLTSYEDNSFTEHKYGRIYFSFGAKFKLNRNK